MHVLAEYKRNFLLVVVISALADRDRTVAVVIAARCPDGVCQRDPAVARAVPGHVAGQNDDPLWGYGSAANGRAPW
jgi:hypothetical protein